MCSLNLWKLINLNLPKKKFILFSFIFIINSTYDLIKLPIIANILFVHVRQTKNVIKLRDKITY